MSLALGWHNLSDVLHWIPQDIGNLMLAVSTSYFIWFLAFYLRKLIARPGVLLEDMRSPPARAGIAAMAMSMMMLAAALLPLNVSVPQVWWTGVVLQIAASAVVLYAIWRDPPQERRFTTFQYLTFVGPVVGPIAGVELGYIRESLWLTIAALVAYVPITIGIIHDLWTKPLPRVLRPSTMIFLAPISLFALSFGKLGFHDVFLVFYWVGWVMFIALLFLVPWMIRGGYSPTWAAFTFPTAAFLNVQILALSKGWGAGAQFGVYLGLAIATPMILFIAYRSVMLWVTGELSRISSAATA